MERLGVSYSPLYPLQMILHLYMYKQFYMFIVDFNSKEEIFQRGNLKSWNLCARLTFYCTVVYSSFQPKSASLVVPWECQAASNSLV